MNLIFDADDTLWENNIYFEQAFDDFCAFLAHSHLQPSNVREVLDEIERANSKIHGYGARNFARNLRQCFERLAEHEWDESHLERVAEFGHAILECPMELIDGVAETIPVLAGKHHLLLFTKGNTEEQTAKIERSGLKPYFRHCAITREKNKAAYIELAESQGLDLEETWMIGNSPKSDINPALAAGMRAVYVPHLRTWGLEKEEILDSDGRLIVVQKFADLQEVFGKTTTNSRK